eukprot:1429235-Pyramimonas_sp.AAC.1
MGSLWKLLSFAMRSTATRMSRFPKNGPGSLSDTAFTVLGSTASATHFDAKMWICWGDEATVRMADFFH